MLEADWLACTEPSTMLRSLQDQAGDLNLRLFGIACLRGPNVWPLLGEMREVVDAAEQMVRNAPVEPPLEDSLRRYLWLAEWPASETAEEASRMALDYAGTRGFEGVNLEWADGDEVEISNRQFAEEKAYQCGLLRCVFGNRFDASTIDPSWQTSTVLALARGIYEARTFDVMPILADALQDAGCANDTVLSHCRGDGPHARGCWVVDLILGKT